MPASKKRGGKKAHNKRIAKRNALATKNKLAMERKFMAMLKEQIEKQQTENNG